MNNLELRKALQKINHACIDCGGDGYSLCEHAGGHVPTDIETGEEYSPCTKECEQHNGDCKTCSGKGIDIPSTLEDLLRALPQLELEFIDLLGKNLYISYEEHEPIKYNLSKTPETQTQEITDQLIEILS